MATFAVGGEEPAQTLAGDCSSGMGAERLEPHQPALPLDTPSPGARPLIVAVCNADNNREVFWKSYGDFRLLGFPSLAAELV